MSTQNHTQSQERDPTTIWTPSEAQGAAPGRGRMQGRRVLVVGAGTQATDEPNPPVGNGRAIAILCAREGAAVACADMDAAAARDTLTMIEKDGGRGTTIVANVAEPEACERVVTEAVQALGGLDGVVVNVGIGRGRGLANTSAEEWDLAFAVNLRAHFLIAKAALPQLKTGSSLVFISSTASLRPGTGIPSYDSSKAGLAGLCRHVGFEGAPRGIRANVVAPGLIDTPLGRNASKRRPNRATTPVPLGRQGTGWEVGYTTLFLLSDEASYITGQVIVMDGGLSGLR
jgi:NAD(P)-dependent dehydrogenase (short-subunit alcohol dehydrogenase family)